MDRKLDIWGSFRWASYTKGTTGRTENLRANRGTPLAQNHPVRYVWMILVLLFMFFVMLPAFIIMVIVYALLALFFLVA